MRTECQTVLRLLVRNHPGVMSHLCGLFARRAFNVEGILCVPLDDGACSAVLLLVADDQRNAQIVAQLRKLEDVIDVHPDPDARASFDAVARYVQPAADG
jgi:acetolactate synthase I/III small subunit